MKHGFETTFCCNSVSVDKPSLEAVNCQRNSGTTNFSNYKCDEQSTGLLRDLAVDASAEGWLDPTIEAGVVW